MSPLSPRIPMSFASTMQAENPYHPQRGGYNFADAMPSHPKLIAYLFWILGIFGAHRFFLGRPVTATIWFFTGGLFLIGWIVDLFLIDSMCEDANSRYENGEIDYSLAWGLHTFLGFFGVHRLYMGKIFTGVLYLLTGGLLGVGYVYDLFTLNDQIDELNRQR